MVESTVDETALLRAESATLRQLLQVLERTAIEQTGRLQRSLEFTSAITESMGEGVLAVDVEGRITFVNRAAEELFGKGREELIGTTLDLSAPLVRESLRSRRTVRAEEDLLTRAGGAKVHVTTTISPIAVGADVTGAIIVVHDITGRKLLVDAGAALATSFEYEKTLQRVARLAIPAFADWAFVHLIERDGSMRRVAVAHSDPEKEKRVAEIEETYPPSLDDAYGPAKVARTGEPELITEVTDEVLAQSTKNREHLEKIRAFGFSSYLSVPLVARDKTLGALTFAQSESHRTYSADDVLIAQQLADRAALAIENARLFSEVEEARRNLEKRVEERTAQLQEANRELESFSYSVSHDLRAPIRHISGFVDMLTKRAGTTLDPTASHYLRVIASSAKYAGNLVDDLLGFSRMGRAGMVRGHVSMNQLVEQATNDLLPEMAGRRVEWNVGDLGEATVDASMMRLVWRNLIGNALKYSRNRDVSRISIGRENAGGEARFFVRDNGVGFDMQYADKLFGVFQRLHTGDQFEGTGIGLANVRRIVARHGGRTWAEGEVEKGATFWFSLPSGGNG